MARLFRGDEDFNILRLFPLAQIDIKQRARNEAMIRGLCANAYLGNDMLLCRVLGRYKMYVDAGDVGLSSHLLLDGYWEMWLTEALAEIIQPGMTVCDIGANLGYFTVLMADLVGPEGRVHAFEPNPSMAERLVRSVAVNGFHARVSLHTDALSDVEADVRLSIPENEPKNAHLVPFDATSDGLALRARRLDGYAEIAAPDVIKIDADTSEEAIWRGMSGILASGRSLTVFLEFAAARYPDPGAFIDEIAAHGFSLAWLTLDNGIEAVTRAQILEASPVDDLMLVLRR